MKQPETIGTTKTVPAVEDRVIAGLKLFGGLGLTATTLLTIYFYFLGVFYWNGFLNRFHLSVSQVRIELPTLLVPSSGTMSALYQLALGYMGAAWGYRAIKKKQETDRINSQIASAIAWARQEGMTVDREDIRGLTEFLPEGHFDGTHKLGMGKKEFWFYTACGLIFWGAAVYYIVYKDWLRPAGNILAGLVGWGLYYALHRLRAWETRIIVMAFCLVLTLWHAWLLGVERSNKPLLRVMIEFDEVGRGEDVGVIAETSDGMYFTRLQLLVKEHRRETIHFVPTQRVFGKQYGR